MRLRRLTCYTVLYFYAVKNEYIAIKNITGASYPMNKFVSFTISVYK